MSNTTVISAASSSKKINSQIDKLSKNASDLNNDVQDIILMVFEHATGVGSGDVTGMARLINRLPDNFDKLGIVKFCQKCSPIRFTKGKIGENSTYSCSLIKENETKRDGTSLYVPWNLDYAKAHKWYEVSADRMKRQLDWYTANSAIDAVDKQIASFERMLKSQIEVDKTEVEVDGKKVTQIQYADRVPDDEKGYIRAIIQQLRATRSAFKSQKLDPINDDGTIGHKEDANEPETRNTGTNG